MDLSIKIPNSINIHNAYVCPPPPKNKVVKFYYHFDWDLKEKSVEDFMYNICNKSVYENK